MKWNDKKGVTLFSGICTECLPSTENLVLEKNGYGFVLK
jgi:hypothetical protein